MDENNDDTAQGAPQGAGDGAQGAPGTAGDQAPQQDGGEERALTPAEAAAERKYRDQMSGQEARIAELEAQVAAAAKSAEAAEKLNGQIEQLKQQMADEREAFALKSAGARSVRAARALLGDYEGDIDALKAGEPWLFADGGGTETGGVRGDSQSNSQTHNSYTTGTTAGATGLEPAGAPGGDDAAYLKRWERIAGLADESKEG